MSDVAPDGSPVEFYRRIPADGEPELIHATMRPGGSVLDLGCGPGRIAGPLSALGHAVTGVDDGPAMLAVLPSGVEGILGDARAIRLGRTFDCVLLASHLVNAVDGAPGFIATAAVHLAPGGVVVGETYPPGWDPGAGVGRVSRLGDAEIQMLRARRDGYLVEAAVRYGVDGLSWEQPFTARILDERALSKLLEDGGLRFDRWLDRPGWFVATVAQEPRGTTRPKGVAVGECHTPPEV